MPELPVRMSLSDVFVSFSAYEMPPRLVDALARRVPISRKVRRIPALKGVSLDVRDGESLGVLGRNGSGKSTLLRVLAGLLPIDSGTRTLRAEARLLGVQAALKQSWTGRQSIEVGLIALGLPRNVASERVDAVAGFAGLRDVIDLPVSTYSSGMRSRLYFSISTEEGSGTLLIDESLATGDRHFLESARKRLQAHLHRADCLVLVSHSIETIRDLCSRAIVLEGGRIVAQGDVADVVKFYLQMED